MSFPVLAIIGRPNVGKSTLFNRLIGRRKAIVRPEPGVTRDRHHARGEWNDRSFLAVDTGGISGPAEDPFNPLILRQTILAIEESDIVLFLTDGIEGLLPADRQIADHARRSQKPVFLAVNKCDTNRAKESLWDFSALGFGDPFPISAEHGTGIENLLEAAFARVPNDGKLEVESEEEIRVAVVGRPNVGKSSFVNRIIGKERALVSAVPGTTRDPIDSLCRRGDQAYRFVDTAGIRKRGKIGDEKVEFLSMIMAYRSIERAEVVLLIIDATDGPRMMDAQIARHIVESGRACIVLVNKWDLLEKETRTFDEKVTDIREKLVHLDFAPILSVSALTGQRCEHVFEDIRQVTAFHRQRISTRKLNLRVEKWVAAHPPHGGRNKKRPKIYYATQASTAPPHIVVFASRLPGKPYARYIERCLREDFDFSGTPIRVSFRKRE
ncbi:MAG: ribosome biogenesis GTPase Der [bacterium]|nr:ribosome biogenesis GTPase Der [bacterium]